MWLFCLRATARMLDVRYRVFILSGPGVMCSARGLGLDSGGENWLVCGEDSGGASLRAGEEEGTGWPCPRVGMGFRGQGPGLVVVLLCSCLWSPVWLLYSGLPAFSQMAAWWRQQLPSSAQSRVLSPCPRLGPRQRPEPRCCRDVGAGPGGGGT